MTDPTIQIDPALTVPYLDQWLGTWFIEPERGRALHGAIRQLNIGVHLDAQASAGSHMPHRIVKSDRDALAQNPDGQPAAIDWEQVPRSRGAYGYRTTSDGVAVLELTGSLMKHEASATESTSTVMMRRSVRKLMNDSQVKAVLFQIDSPGGTVAGIYELASDIAQLARVKPVHAHAANLCASAAYLLASQMRSISATASSLVGSMGTFGVVYDLSEMAAREGVKVHLLKGRINGKDAMMKGAGTPGTAISDEQLARMQEGVDDLNQQFFDAVLAGPRKPGAAAVEGWFADAGVWVAAKAKAMGLIDRVESFDDMLARISGEAKNGKRLNNQTNQAGGTSAGDPKAEDAGATTGDPSAAAGSEAEASLPKEADMSANAQQQQAGATAPASAVNPPAATAPAIVEPSVTAARPGSMPELRAACPGASSDFLVEAAEKEMTVAQAKDAFIGFQAAQIRARDEQIARLGAAQPAQPAQPGEPGEPGGAAQSTEASAVIPQAQQPPARKPGVAAIASAAAEQGEGGSLAYAEGDHKGQAHAEWASNVNGCRAAFISERVYVGARVAELRGRVKTAEAARK